MDLRRYGIFWRPPFFSPMRVTHRSCPLPAVKRVNSGLKIRAVSDTEHPVEDEILPKRGQGCGIVRRELCGRKSPPGARRYPSPLAHRPTFGPSFAHDVCCETEEAVTGGWSETPEYALYLMADARQVVRSTVTARYGMMSTAETSTLCGLCWLASTD